MAVKYSIIVPIFNAEKYLDRCVGSILSQTYVNWELILVDDGSSDNSGKICDEYAMNDSRIMVFHQTNTGPGAARNVGLSHASGQYILFIDSDDWVESTFLEEYAKITESEDLVYQGYVGEFTDGRSVVHADWQMDERDIPKAIMSLWQRDNFGYTWMKRYKRSIIEENQIRFDTKIFFREDTVFTAQYCRYCSSIRVLPVALYHYQENLDSLLHTRFNVKEMLDADRLIYNHFSVYFANKAFKRFTDGWFLVNLHNGIKKSYVKENASLFTHEERIYLINSCLALRKEYDMSSFKYSAHSFLNTLLRAVWITNRSSLIDGVLKLILR